MHKWVLLFFLIHTSLYASDSANLDDDVLFRAAPGMYTGLTLDQLLPLQQQLEQQLKLYDSMIGKVKAEEMQSMLATGKAERKAATALSWTAKVGTMASGIADALLAAIGVPAWTHYITAVVDVATTGCMHLSERLNSDAAKIEKKAVSREAAAYQNLQQVNAAIDQRRKEQAETQRLHPHEVRLRMDAHPSQPVSSTSRLALDEPDDPLYENPPGMYQGMPLPELQKRAEATLKQLEQYDVLIGKAQAESFADLLIQAERERTASSILSWSSKGFTLLAAGTGALVTALSGPVWVMYIVAGVNIMSPIGMHISEYLIDDARSCEKHVVQRRADTYKDYIAIISEIKKLQSPGASVAPNLSRPQRTEPVNLHEVPLVSGNKDKDEAIGPPTPNQPQASLGESPKKKKWVKVKKAKKKALPKPREPLSSVTPTPAMLVPDNDPDVQDRSEMQQVQGASKVGDK